MSILAAPTLPEHDGAPRDCRARPRLRLLPGTDRRALHLAQGSPPPACWAPTRTPRRLHEPPRRRHRPPSPASRRCFRPSRANSGGRGKKKEGRRRKRTGREVATKRGGGTNSTDGEERPPQARDEAPWAWSWRAVSPRSRSYRKSSRCRRGRTAKQREPVVDPLSGQALVSASPVVPSPAPRAQIEPGTEQVEKALGGTFVHIEIGAQCRIEPLDGTRGAMALVQHRLDGLEQRCALGQAAMTSSIRDRIDRFPDEKITLTHLSAQLCIASILVLPDVESSMVA